MVFLHGLYGYGRNWWSIARQLSSQFRVLMPDLRNHGESFHNEEINLPVMAEDLGHWLNSLSLPSYALFGHSLGGKVAMQYALASQDPKLKHLGVLDIAPKAYSADYHQGVLQALCSLPLDSLESRQQADALLQSQIPEADVRSFLLSSLRRSPEGWAWQLNLQALQQQLPELVAAVSAEQVFAGCPVSFIAGTASSYVQDSDLPAIQALFPQAQLYWLKDAGHWLHVDQPEALLALLYGFLK